jgi:hypothetical protein
MKSSTTWPLDRLALVVQDLSARGPHLRLGGDAAEQKADQQAAHRQQTLHRRSSS